MYCPFSMYWSQAQLCQYAAPAIFPITYKDLPARHKFITLLWVYIPSLLSIPSFSPFTPFSPRYIALTVPLSSFLLKVPFGFLFQFFSSCCVLCCCCFRGKSWPISTFCIFLHTFWYCWKEKHDTKMDSNLTHLTKVYWTSTFMFTR